MTLTGTVSNIIFYNNDNGYCVLELTSDADGGEYICVGNMPVVTVGEHLTLEGKFTVHQKFGEQFAVQKIVVTAPQNNDGLVKYLSSGLIKGVGIKTAEAIVNTFKERTVDIITQNPIRLAEIKGISKQKAMVIANCYAEHIDMQKQIMFLQGYGISTNTSIKIYNAYKENTQRILTKNPYKLIDDIDGIGFITADKIAQSMGIASDSEFRLRAGVVYCLKESAEKLGNTYLDVETLVADMREILSLDMAQYVDLLEKTLENLQFDLMCNLFYVDGKRCIALSKYYKIEKNIASNLINLKYTARPLNIDTAGLIDEFERVNDIKFHPNQRQAIDGAVNNGVTVITGGPGTGKTTIIKCISYIFNALKLRIEYCTPTGRAAKRLSQSTGQEAKTIHRMLGMEYRDGNLRFAYNKHNKMSADVVIVDELSMADVVIINSLLNALKDGCRIVLVGDKDQLPSVGAGNILADVIASKLIDVNYLTYIYRQSEDSLIVSNAHLINQCKMPVIDNESKDFFVNYKDNQQDILDTVTQMVSRRLPSYAGVKPTDIQVLCPLKGGIAGVNNLNAQLQRLLNPKKPREAEMYHGNVCFRTGDKVMQVQNDYSMEWQKNNPDGTIEEGTGVFNGDIGFVTEIAKDANLLFVTFEDGRQAKYSGDGLENLRLAYAVTIHKSQGSEFDVALITVINGPPTILNKNLLYTAVTRAKKMVVLVCSKKVLGMMVSNNYVKKRTTMLKKFLSEENAKYVSVFGG